MCGYDIVWPNLLRRTLRSAIVTNAVGFFEDWSGPAIYRVR